MAHTTCLVCALQRHFLLTGVEWSNVSNVMENHLGKPLSLSTYRRGMVKRFKCENDHLGNSNHFLLTAIEWLKASNVGTITWKAMMTFYLPGWNEWSNVSNVMDNQLRNNDYFLPTEIECMVKHLNCEEQFLSTPWNGQMFSNLGTITFYLQGWSGQTLKMY